MRNRPEPLFSKGAIYSVLQAHKEKIGEFIERKEPDYLLKVSEPDFIAHVLDTFKLDVPRLLEDRIYAEEPQETKVDVTGDWHYGQFGDGPVIVNGMMTTVAVPFEGDRNFFFIQPMTHTHGVATPHLTENELRFEFTQTKVDSNEIKREFDQGLKGVRDNLNSLRESVTQHETTLPVFVKEKIEKRKKRLLESRGTVEALGIPVKRRDGAPEPAKVPMQRKKVVVAPKVPPGEFKPEYHIEEAVYQDILGLMGNMTQVMEYSPGAFLKMKEEDLRFQFLVQLNAQFQGQATGETFNYDGKTDILIRTEGRNVFIAECKFWTGEKAFLETIDQLLGYLSWRDTKSALVIFNRNVNFTEVLQAIVAAVPKHPHFKRDEGKRGDSTFRYVFGHPEDTNRELTVTVMAFNVPVALTGKSSA